MNRTEFEALRNLPGKVIREDIKFSKRQATAPSLVAEGIPIENADGVQLRLNINFNPEIGSKTFNVHVPGVGPICRLDVDGPKHHPAGRCHKHSVQTERCPDRNLPDNVMDRPDLAGRSVRECLDVFCAMAGITISGGFDAPDASSSS